MSEQGNTLSYALTAHVGRSPKSVGVGRYSAQMKSTGLFGDAELQEALAVASAADEGVFLVSLKTGERVATAELKSSNLVEVVCRFAELPSAGRYRLVVATRCGLGGEYRVVEAGREVEVK